MAAHSNKNFDSDETNADRKYYKSHGVSAISGVPTTFRGRTPPKSGSVPVHTNKHFDSEETNADKKYYRSNPLPNAVQVISGAAESGVITPLQLKHAADAHAVRDRIIKLLKGGAKNIIVQCAAGTDALLIMQLDLAQARQQITAQQHAAVRFEGLPHSGEEVARATFGAVDPAAVPAGTEADSVLSDEEMRQLVFDDAPATETTGIPPVGAAVPVMTGVLKDLPLHDTGSAPAGTTPLDIATKAAAAAVAEVPATPEEPATEAPEAEVAPVTDADDQD